LVEQQAEMNGLVARIDQLVAALRERDQVVEKDFDTLERRLNRHRVAIDRVEEQVSSLASRIHNTHPKHLPTA
jgi:uncharacterized coiled-coil protein SlyX